ncbi:flagellin N-terminal-like domain-containing protein [Halovenus aranensis]|uniref:Flagellin N-terminal-like domain-containing protein n=1 Tax=Halovenus aranensis TaxID=890420 RepID=A0A1G8Y6T5_9EURY|nr:type IV pilin N-terminal domain-containing protein [Halovenus aranensis]SDJ97875.1 flagellin N-terminal-like domain-containing protein [Halovenus aranensis]
MQIKNLFEEDDAVSPVIGVILMVAITVILAAVIASFVLGLGDTAGEVQPQATWNFEYEEANTDSYDFTGNTDYGSIADGTLTEGNGTLEITVSDGEAVETADLYIRGDGIYEDTSDGATAGTAGDATETDEIVVADIADVSEDEFSASEGFTIPVDDNYDIDLVWDTGDDSSTLDEDKGPEA